MSINKLEELAKEATPGEWVRENCTDVFTQCGAVTRGGIVADSSDGWQICDTSVGRTLAGGEIVDLPFIEAMANASYIAAANPAAILTITQSHRDLLEEIKMVLVSAPIPPEISMPAYEKIKRAEGLYNE